MDRVDDLLITTGAYAHLRHPQYLGIILISAGWLATGRQFFFFLFLFLDLWD
ncbi:MAG: isoprenylcysteine carboxylmethyltransferase family protein [Candidatus Bathyarchaeia archaeon]